MLKDEYVSRVALFFYFAFENEKQVVQATEHAVAKLKNRVREDRMTDEQIKSELIRTCAQFFFKYVSSPPRIRVGAPHIEQAFLLPPGLSLAVWRRYLKHANPEEILSFILVAILKLSEEEVAEALGLNKGTIRYRVGKSYHILADNMVADL